MKLKFLILLLCMSFSSLAQEKTTSSEVYVLVDKATIKKLTKSKKVKIHKITSKSTVNSAVKILSKSKSDLVLVTYNEKVIYGVTTYDDRKKIYKKLLKQQEKCEKSCKSSLSECEAVLAIASLSGKCYCACLDIFNTFDDIIDRENPF